MNFGIFLVREVYVLKLGGNCQDSLPCWGLFLKIKNEEILAEEREIGIWFGSEGEDKRQENAQFRTGNGS